LEERGDQAFAQELEVIILVELAKRYSTRELVAQILGKQMDTYDLDMEIAFKVPLSPRLGGTKDVQLWMLSLELGLIPPQPISIASEMLEHAIEDGMGDLSPILDYGEPINKMAKVKLDQALYVAIRQLEEHGIRIRVHFSSEDWRGGSFWGNFSSFSTSADYEITFDILRLIMPLVRVDGKATDADPDQWKIATVFYKKILLAVRKKMQDPKVREILGLQGENTGS